MKMMQGAFFFACSNMSRTRRRADADEHLDEVGAGDGEERHVGLAGDGAGEQRLAGAGRADEQHAARDAPAEPLELLRVAQELDDLLQVLLGLVDAGDVLEGDAAMRLGQELRLRLAEAHAPCRRPPCICRMKKIHTARIRNIGNQETSMPTSDWPPSVGGLAVIVTPRLSSRLTSSGSSGA